MRVLYLEDNALDADLTRRALGKLAPEMDLTTVPTLAEGMKLLQQVGKPFDIILSDFHLTDGNALELLRALPGLHVSLPFVVVTGHGDEEQAVTALKAGADDYVVKQKDYLDHLADILKRAQDTHRTYRHRHELPLHVLYLEHHPTDVELTEQHINRYAPYIHLHVESNAAAGLSLLPEYGGVSAFDVVVTDLNMPGMSGLDILKEIKQVRNLEIPVVIVTGQGDEELAIQTLKLGADDYLVKTGNYLFNLPSLLENAFFRVQLQREKEALRASEERFRLLAENAQDMVYRLRLSPELRYEYVSPSAERMTGYKPEAFYTNPRLGFEMAYPEDKHLLEPLIHPKAKFERTISLRWIRKDGQIIWVEQKNTPIYDENKTLVAIEGIVRDITERRLAAAAVQESELRFRSLFDHATDAILIMEDCAFIDCNKMAEELYGWSKAEIYGRMPWEFSPEKQADGRDSQTEAKERIAAALKGKTQFFEWKHIHRDGSVFDAEVHLNRLVLPDKTLLVAQVRDITAKKEMGEALLESETKLRAIVEQVPAVVYTETFDPERRVIFISPQVETLFGYTPEEWMAVPGFWVSIVHADDLKRVLENDAKVVKTGEHSLDEYRIRCRDGAYCWVSDEARLIRDKNGKLLLWQGVLTDITERKQAEERLRESEERFATMFRTSPAAIAMTRMRDNILIDVNGAWERITGYPRTEAIGNAASRLNLWVEPAQRDQMIEMMRKQGSASGEVKIRQKSGEYCETLMSGEIIELAGEKYLLTMAQDITERKQAEEALRESESKLRATVEQVPAVIYTESQGSDRRTTYISPRLTAMFGYTPEEWMKDADFWKSAVHPEDLARVVDEDERTHRSGEDFKTEYRMARRDGIYRWVTDTARLIRDEEGKPMFWQGVLQDITERKEAEEALRRSHQETEHANHLLLALSQAAQALQNVRTQKEVYEALQEHMDALGYSTSIFELADNGRALKLTYAKYNPSLIRKAEKLVGLRMSDFTFRPQPGGIYDRVLMQGETVHTEDSEQVVKEVIPKKLHALAQPITDLLHMKLTTSAPLIVGEKVIGVLTINGAKLSEADNPAIMAFARQAAIAIQNALLFEQKQQEINERKRAEEKLRESEELISKFIENSPIYAYVKEVTPTESRVIKASENFTEMIGIPGSKMIGKTMEELFPAEFATKITADDWQVASGGRILKLDEDLNGRNYTTFKFPIVQGEKTLLAGYTVDFTQRKQAEEKIRESEEKFRFLAENMIDIIWIIDLNFRNIYVSPSVEKLLGYTVEERMGMSPEEMLTPDSLSHARERLAKELKAIARGDRRINETLTMELEYYHKNGSTLWMESAVRLMLDATGEPTGIYGVSRDITERRKAEMALRESEEKFRLLLESSGVGAGYYTLNGTVLLFNSKAAENMGGKPDDFIGKSIGELFPQAKEEYLRRIKAAARSATAMDYQDCVDLPTGRKWFLSNYSKVVDSHGTIIGVQILSHDITKQKEAEEAVKLLNTTLEQRVAERTLELQDAQEKLVRQEKLAVLGQLAGGVGHELRNPLGVIKNAIYYLRMVQPDADEKIKEYLGIIDSETRVADKIITDLLDFSRIKSVDREAVTIGELVEGALQRFPPNEHIKVIKKIPEPDQKIYADPRQMVQVLGNLTVNACQAMPEGGTLTISAVVKGNEATIAVKDNGTGILPENLNKLFEPLFTTKAKGIGLGLAVSKKLMEANSGRISVKSEAGKGSTFTLHLPVAH